MEAKSGRAPNRVKYLRETLGVSKNELCRRAPVSIRELTLIEQGHVPGLRVARRIAENVIVAPVPLADSEAAALEAR